MISLPTYSGETAVFGLGRSGLAAVAALRAAGNNVMAWDDNEAPRQAAADLGAVLQNPVENFGSAARLIVSPGVPLTHPRPHAAISAARAAGAEIIGDMDLFHDALQHAGLREDVTLIGITGTNGKSTTTALIAHMLKSCGQKVHVGGNIGTPVLQLPIEAGAIYVLELSSYQLDLNRRFAADIGVWLNITPDHLERHGDLDGYVAAKANLFADGKCARAKIISVDDAPSRAIADSLAGNVIRLGADHFDMNLTNCAALRGAHNAQNATAARAVGRELGMADADIQAALESFAGMPHRLQAIAAHKGVTFVNDSKATNSEATRHALAAFDNIYWIAGGRAKRDSSGQLDLAPLLPHMKNIRSAYLIGEAAQAFADTLPANLPTHIVGTIDRAVREAAGQALADTADAPVVLLSPACASFDQFKDFEARGAAFVDAVHGWTEGAS